MLSLDQLDGRDWAASLIGWWQDAGLDCLVDDAPRNWLAAGDAPGRRADDASADARAPSPPAPSQPVLPPAARPAPAVLPATLDAFAAWRVAGDDIPEATWAEAAGMASAGGGPRRVGSGGDAGAALAIVTDMPDPEDLDQAMLLSGPAGLLFDRMLAAIGLARPAIWLAPLAVARPVAGQVPAADQPALGAILRHQLGLTGATQLLVMGDAASRALTGTETARARGRFHSVNLGDRTVAVAATFHPRLLLRRPALKAEAWTDLQMVAARMTGGGSQCG